MWNILFPDCTIMWNTVKNLRARKISACSVLKMACSHSTSSFLDEKFWQMNNIPCYFGFHWIEKTIYIGRLQSFWVHLVNCLVFDIFKKPDKKTIFTVFLAFLTLYKIKIPMQYNECKQTVKMIYFDEICQFKFSRWYNHIKHE